MTSYFRRSTIDKPLPQQPRARRRLPRLAGYPALAAAWLGAGFLLAACTTVAPQLRLHSLLDANAEFAAAGAAQVSVGAPVRLTIAPIKLPAAVNQPQWLVRRADDSLQLLEQDRWASPLADEFRAALHARLTARWGAIDAVLPGTANADEPSWRLLLEIVRLDARPGAETLLDVRWTLMPPQHVAAKSICAVRIVEPVNGEGTLPIAAAHRRSVLRLADMIGAQLRSSLRDGGASAQGCGDGLRS